MKRKSYSSSIDPNGIYTRTRSSTSSPKRRKGQPPVINENDLISKLPDELLEMILSTLSLKEAAITSMLSSRWQRLWWHRPNLVLDMRTALQGGLQLVEIREAAKSLIKSFNKAMKNHVGDLESCTIYYFDLYKNKKMLEGWIRSATCVKNTKALRIVSLPNNELLVAPKIFSHRSLISLALKRFILPSADGFNSCSNLKTLKLQYVVVDVGDINVVIAACSSLEVLVLQKLWLTGSGVFRIENNNLKYLQLNIKSPSDRIEVHALRLEVLDIRCVVCAKENFILVAPNLKFNRNYTNASLYPHMTCNISYLTQEKKSIWYELITSGLRNATRVGSLSISIDIDNPKEVGILKDFLFMWDSKMGELEIFFKKNHTIEEGECSTIGRERRNVWEKTKMFFFIPTVWIYNLSDLDKKEFEFVSQFANDGWPRSLVRNLMIETSSYPPMKKLKVEAQVDDKLVPFIRDKQVRIQFF